MTDRTPPRALVVQRFTGDNPQTTTAELHDLVRATGCSIVGTLTQQREEDSASEIGSGKIETLREQAYKKSADVVVFNQRLSPYQIYNIASALPNGIAVWGEYRLYIEALSERATSHREQLQVEMLRLRRDLPRVEAKQNLRKREYHPETMNLQRYTEGYDRVLRDKVKARHEELDSLATQEESRRNKQRDDGITHATLIGQTNSGKSTLFNTLTSPETPQTVSPGALETFESLTRRQSGGVGDVLYTDTLGVLPRMPYWMQDSLKVSFASLVSTDVLLLCVNVNNPLPTVHDRLNTMLEFVESYTAGETPVQVVFTHGDVVPAGEQEEKLSAVQSLAPDPVVVDGRDEAAIDRVSNAMQAYIPDEQTEQFQIPLSSQGMSLVSWLHDHATIKGKQYTGESVWVEFTADPITAGKARSTFQGLN